MIVNGTLHPDRQTSESLVSWHQWQLPLNVLNVSEFDVRETVGELFSIKARLFAKVEDAVAVDPEGMIGLDACVGIQLAEGRRFFNGVLTRLRRDGDDDSFVYFSAELSPWTWLLTQKSDCRVFQEMSATEIIDQVFGELRDRFTNLVHHRSKARRTCTKRDTCVQYNETDYDFVRRLMREEGIYFFFEHEEKRHTLVLADGPLSHDVCPFQHQIPLDGGNDDPTRPDFISSWRDRRSLTPGSHASRDYHFQISTNRLDVDAPSLVKVGNRGLDLYEYSGRFASPFNHPDERLEDVRHEGAVRCNLEMHRAEAQHQRINGKSVCRAFLPGFKFSRILAPGQKEHPAGFLLTSVHHTGKMVAGGSNTKNKHGLEYGNSFKCVPADVLFQPPWSPQKTVIHSVQTARVVGPADEQIHVDKFGRVKVQFHWDRYGENDELSSAWIRVGQVWAGNMRGAHFWPRVGDEVIVAFVNGDADRPIVVGSVYNDANMPPYALPEHRTRSGIKTRSTPDGDSSQFNELRFEDKKGHEQIYVHAERNLKTTVEASESRSVGASRSTTVGQDDSLTVSKGDRSAEILKGHDQLKIQEGNREVGIAQGDDALFVVNGNADVDVPIGHYQVKANEILFEATSTIRLKCGPSEIVMNPATITINVPGDSIKLVPGIITVDAPLVAINS